jgi:hypothetical protein
MHYAKVLLPIGSVGKRVFWRAASLAPPVAQHSVYQTRGIRPAKLGWFLTSGLPLSCHR